MKQGLKMKNKLKQDELSTAEAAEYIGYSKGTLAVSRGTGILSGVAAPKYIKRGHVFYKKTDLDEWMKQFEDQES